ncbi:MAG: fructoselysine 6-kinase [Atribacterota bacterium]|nr:fructoselysine 6-kinase [Atribacterota bacterium]
MQKVIGIGDNVVDKYLNLKTMFPGGNTLNFCVFAKKLGCEVAYIGNFGNDEAAGHIIKVLNEMKIDISHCRQYRGENGYAEVEIIERERVFIGSNKGGVSAKHPIILNKNDLNYIKQFDLVHSSCYSYLEKELFKIKNINIPISFDFSNKIEDIYLNAICPYLNYSFLSCSHLTEEETKRTLQKAISYGSELALATRGIYGSILLYNQKYYYQNVNKVKTIDTLGAGDSFITSFLLNVIKEKNKLSKEDIRKILLEASYHAAKTCLVHGAFGYGKKIKII